MKIKGLGWVILCILVLALLAVQAQQKPAAPSGAKNAESVVPQKLDIPGLGIDTLKLSPGIDPKWNGLISLGELIQKDIAALEGSFAKGDSKAFMGLLALRHAVVAGIDYALTCAGDSGAFWKTVRTPGATLELRVVSVYVSNAPGPHAKLPVSAGTPPVKPSAGKMQYDAIAFVAMEIHVISKTEAGVKLRNDTYFMNLALRHQWCTVWGEEEVCPPIGI
jgi:hypothetical protein